MFKYVQAWVWLRGVAESQWAAQDAGRLCTKGIYIGWANIRAKMDTNNRHDVDVAGFDSVYEDINVALDAGWLYTRRIMSTSIKAYSGLAKE